MSESVARPLVKFVGGKTQLLPELRKYVPESFGRYWEPFMGGAAMFYDLYESDKIQNGATLSDMNEFLVRTYLAVRDHVDIVIDWLRGHERAYKDAGSDEAKLAYYLSVRAAMGHPGSFGPNENEAARLIFTNKTGYNGLFRVNSHGRFNVPMGNYANPTICDEENLRACSRALQMVEIRYCDFADALMDALPGDFVYMDPPYVAVNDTSDFTSYTAGKFTMADQTRLRDVALHLKRREVRVVLSNADVPAVRELYKDFTIHAVQARRNVNSNAGKRGKVGEVIIT